MNEDFGYLKEEEQGRGGAIVKKCVLAGAVIFSALCFIYISINAYHFIYNDEASIKTIKSPEGEIKVVQGAENNSGDELSTISDMDKAVYENIVGNKKESLDKNKNIKMPEKPMVAPVDLANKAKKEAISGNKNNERVIIYDATKEKKPVIKDEVSGSTNAVQKIDKNKFIGKSSKNRVQLAAMNSNKSANDYWDKLNKQYSSLFAGLKPIIQEVDLGQRGTFYRLQVGGFRNQVEAENFCMRFLSKSSKTKADCIVVE